MQKQRGGDNRRLITNLIYLAITHKVLYRESCVFKEKTSSHNFHPNSSSLKKISHPYRSRKPKVSTTTPKNLKKTSTPLNHRLETRIQKTCSLNLGSYAPTEKSVVCGFVSHQVAHGVCLSAMVRNMKRPIFQTLIPT